MRTTRSTAQAAFSSTSPSPSGSASASAGARTFSHVNHSDLSRSLAKFNEQKTTTRTAWRALVREYSRAFPPAPPRLARNTASQEAGGQEGGAQAGSLEDEDDNDSSDSDSDGQDIPGYPTSFASWAVSNIRRPILECALQIEFGRWLNNANRPSIVKDRAWELVGVRSFGLTSIWLLLLYLGTHLVGSWSTKRCHSYSLLRGLLRERRGTTIDELYPFILGCRSRVGKALPVFAHPNPRGEHLTKADLTQGIEAFRQKSGLRQATENGEGTTDGPESDVGDQGEQLDDDDDDNNNNGSNKDHGDDDDRNDHHDHDVLDVHDGYHDHHDHQSEVPGPSPQGQLRNRPQHPLPSGVGVSSLESTPSAKMPSSSALRAKAPVQGTLAQSGREHNGDADGVVKRPSGTAENVEAHRADETKLPPVKAEAISTSPAAESIEVGRRHTPIPSAKPRHSLADSLLLPSNHDQDGSEVFDPGYAFGSSPRVDPDSLHFPSDGSSDAAPKDDDINNNNNNNNDRHRHDSADPMPKRRKMNDRRPLPVSPLSKHPPFLDSGKVTRLERHGQPNGSSGVNAGSKDEAKTVDLTKDVDLTNENRGGEEEEDDENDNNGPLTGWVSFVDKQLARDRSYNFNVAHDRMRSGRWLNDTAIEHVAKAIIAQTHQEKTAGFFTTVVYSTFTHSEQFPSSTSSDAHRKTLASLPARHRYSFLPINEAQNHWILVVVDRIGRQFTLYDPMRAPIYSRLMENVTRLVEWIYKDDDDNNKNNDDRDRGGWRIRIFDTIAAQTNGDDCGVLVLGMIQHLCRHDFEWPTSNLDSSSLRRLFAYYLGLPPVLRAVERQLPAELSWYTDRLAKCRVDVFLVNKALCIWIDPCPSAATALPHQRQRQRQLVPPLVAHHADLCTAAYDAARWGARRLRLGDLLVRVAREVHSRLRSGGCEAEALAVARQKNVQSIVDENAAALLAQISQAVGAAAAPSEPAASESAASTAAGATENGLPPALEEIMGRILREYKQLPMAAGHRRPDFENWARLYCILLLATRFSCVKATKCLAHVRRVQAALPKDIHMGTSISGTE
ncbi:hypothetical protein GGR56DRAFT_661903 [Xylariaceae sp. FL0804]|nr:hypothetical protein GGR56DRAFT_661903 [Xylariaceae sp. FL0804]